MKKVISVILLLAMVIGCFVGCAPKEDAALNAAAEYLYAMYKDAKATTDADYTVVSQIRIDDVFPNFTLTSRLRGEGSIRKHHPDLAGRSQMMNHVLKPSKVRIAGRRHSVLPTNIVFQLISAPV